MTLRQCAAKEISVFMIFAVSVMQVNDCRPYTPFQTVKFFHLLVVVRRSIVRCDLRADVRSDERALVTYPTLSDAGQHAARSDDVLRHDADRSHPEPVLTGRGDCGRLVAVHDSIVAEHVLQRCRHSRHHQLLHADIPLRRRSTSRPLLPDTGMLMNFIIVVVVYHRYLSSLSS